MASLYHHFGSKQELLVAIMREAMADLTSCVSEAVEAAGDDPREQLAAAMRAHVRFHTEHRPEVIVADAELRVARGAGPGRDHRAARSPPGALPRVRSSASACTQPGIVTAGVITMCTDVAMWFRSDGPLDADGSPTSSSRWCCGGIDAMSDESALLVDRPRAGRRAADAEPAGEAQRAVEGADGRPAARRFGELGGRRPYRCAVLTGAPPAFCAGGDLVELRHADVEGYAAYCASYQRSRCAIRDLPFPLIAAVNGAAVAGGFELMCMCDMRVASDDAFIVTGDADLGLPTTSGLSLAAAPAGRRRPRALADLVEPRVIGAEAQRWAWSRCCARPARSLARALDMAATIAAKPGDGIRLTRRTSTARSSRATSRRSTPSSSRSARASPTRRCARRSTPSSTALEDLVAHHARSNGSTSSGCG